MKNDCTNNRDGYCELNKIECPGECFMYEPVDKAKCPKCGSVLVGGARFNWCSKPGCDYQEANI